VLVSLPAAMATGELPAPLDTGLQWACASCDAANQPHFLQDEEDVAPGFNQERDISKQKPGGCISLERALHLPTVLQLHTPTLRLTRLAQEHRSTGRQLADHITAMFSAAISAAASSPDVVWDFHFSATHRSRSRAEPMVSKGSISFTNFL